MNYLIFGSITIIGVFIVIHYLNKRKREKQIAQIREGWGKPKTEAFHFESIKKYADATNENSFHRLTDQTMEDIDLHGLFTFVDRTTSKVGQQFLFKKVIEPTDNLEGNSENLVELFTRDKDLRENVQLELLKLSENDAYHISSLIQPTLLTKPWWFKLLIFDLLVVITLIIFSFSFPVLLLALIIPIALNMYLHYWNKGNTSQFIRSFPQLNVLIQVSKTLLKKGAAFYEQSVEGHIAALKSFQQKANFITVDNSVSVQAELSLVGMYVVELLKAIFLIEVFTLYKLTKELETRQGSVVSLFNYVGNIDASISIASLRAGSKTCRPTLTPPKKEVNAKNMYHPLIENCVGNDLSINGKSILITGSNMSGKSTFLRTLVINSILAQTIYTCFADEFTAPILKQFSSIRIDDNIFEGKSYYFQEVNIMAGFIAEVESSHQNLFILDEVFKGTNTVERIAAAKAILSYLNRNNNIVVVSTHDIELADMLEEEYALCHFTETIENNELHFDHRMKEGQLKTRNAIKILKLSNYPTAIINEARQISAALSSNRIMND